MLLVMSTLSARPAASSWIGNAPTTTRIVHMLTTFVNASAVTVSVNASDALSSVSASVRVDGGAWQSVSSSSSVSLTRADGTHRIESRGADAAGNTQPPPYDGVDVSVGTTPPWISVVAGAVSAFNSLSVVSVPVTVSDATSTMVRGLLDGSADSVVSRVGGGVLSVGVAADGNHTLVLSSEDAAGNAGAVVSVPWYTDRVSPATRAHRDTPSSFNGAVANVSVSCVNEAFPGLCVACWQYAVVSSVGSTLTSMGGCESTTTLSFGYTLDGVASVDVFSVDAAGNVGGNASRVTWVWDHSAPDTVVSVDGGVWLPGVGAWLLSSASASVLLTSTEAVLRYDVSVDGGVSATVVNSSSLELHDLAAGRHVVVASAVDVAGNIDDSPALVTAVVDVTAPPPPRFTLLHECGCFVLPRSPEYVCNSIDAAAFDAACSEADSVDTAPCLGKWHIDTASLSSGGGGGGCCVVGGDVNTSSVGAVWTRAATSTVVPTVARDGEYRVCRRTSDDAGNAGVASSMVLWLDTTPPSKVPSFVATPGATTSPQPRDSR
jgi:hypothetical protein